MAAGKPVDERTIGPYRIIEPLGRGSMGDVFLVIDTRSGRHYTLKEPSDQWLRQPNASQRLRDEAAAAAGLRHPQIAAVHEVLDIGGRPYVVADYVEGESLAARLRRGVSIERAVVVAIDIAEAVAAAHAQGIVHHNLKPANVRLTPEGRGVVTDFGVARLREGSAGDVPRSLTSAVGEEGRFLGTPGYAAPEQVTGRGVDRRSDIYSIGVMLFEMLTGRLPFEGSDAVEVALATITAPVPSVRRYTASVPAALDAIVGRALAKNPKARFESASQIALELKQVLRALGERPAVPLDEQWAPANPTAAPPAVSASRAVLIGVIVVAALAVAIGLALW